MLSLQPLFILHYIEMIFFAEGFALTVDRENPVTVLTDFFPQFQCNRHQRISTPLIFFDRHNENFLCPLSIPPSLCCSHLGFLTGNHPVDLNAIAKNYNKHSNILDSFFIKILKIGRKTSSIVERMIGEW